MTLGAGRYFFGGAIETFKFPVFVESQLHLQPEMGTSGTRGSHLICVHIIWTPGLHLTLKMILRYLTLCSSKQAGAWLWKVSAIVNGLLLHR